MTFTIKQGEQFCSPRNFKMISGSELKFRARFNASAFYQLQNATPAQAAAINKLYGFQEGFTDANSARIGWNCLDGKLFVYPYVHVNGVNLGAQDPPPIAQVQPGEWIYYSIRTSGDTYIFTVNDQVRITPRKAGFIKVMNWPYFGGRLPAPHTITIEIENLP